MVTLIAARYNTVEYVGTGVGDDDEQEQVEEENGSDNVTIKALVVLYQVKVNLYITI